MFAPGSVLLDDHLAEAEIVRVTKGKPLLGWLGARWKKNHVLETGVRVAATAIVLVTASGRRLSCAGGQRVAIRGRTGVLWKRAEKVHLGNLLYVVEGGILTIDRVTCVVQATKPGEPWLTVRTDLGTLFVEGVLCRAS